eukprot:1388412-Amorphochlora_amoeboformis.AAC.1
MYMYENLCMCNSILDRMRDEQLADDAARLAYKRHTDRRQLFNEAHQERNEHLLKRERERDERTSPQGFFPTLGAF